MTKDDHSIEKGPLGENRLGPTLLIDTFAEAFPMRYTRVIVTAADDYWLDVALRTFTGYGTSVISCDAEVGVEQMLSPADSPDGRPGAAVLAFAFSADALAKAMPKRVGQCLMTCPTTAVYNGLPDTEKSIPLGKHLRYFGDGFQKSKLIDDRRYWRIPVMDGEFLVEEKLGVAKGVAGGNIEYHSARRVAGNYPGGSAPSQRSVGQLSRSHHPFPRRRSAQRQQSWLEVQRADRLGQRSVLPNSARARAV